MSRGPVNLHVLPLVPLGFFVIFYIMKQARTTYACLCPRACFFSLFWCLNLCPIPYPSACKLKKCRHDYHCEKHYFNLPGLPLLTNNWQIGNCEEELPKKPVGRLSVDCRPSVGRLSAVCWPTVGRLLARLSAVCWPTGFHQNIDYQSADSQPTNDRQSANSW